MYRPLVRTLVFALTVSALCASSASADTAQEKFEKLYNKLLVTTGKFTPKIACVCQSTNEVGVVTAPPVAVPPYVAYCTTPAFNADGSVMSLTNCGAFTMLKP